MTATATGSTQFCTFWLGRHFLGVPVESVQEILRQQPMTPVPLAPGCVSGLINLRGSIMTAIDLRCRLGMNPCPQTQPVIVVLRREDDYIGLLVDRIGDVLEASDAGNEPVPDTVKGELKSLLRGVYKLEPDLMLSLDIHRVLELGVTAEEETEDDG